MVSGSQNEPGRTLNTRFLVLGFIGTLLVAVLTLGIAVIEATRIEHATIELADNSQRSTYYLGEVGEQLARLRAYVALGLQEPPEGFARRAARISEAEALLQTALDALTGAFQPAEERHWVALRREVLLLRQTYVDAVAAIRTGALARASELLAHEASAATAVHDSLDDLQQLHRERVLAELRVQNREAARIGSVEVVLVGLFLAGMIAIWGGMIGILRRQRRRLAEYTSRLEEVNVDLDSFAGRVAHDLKNALAPVVMGPSLLRRFSQNPTRVEEVVDRIDRCSRKAIGLVDALLAFSRASRDVEASESGSLRTAVRGVLEELVPEIARLDVTVEGGDVPDLQLRCNPGLLHVVLANLCGNAVKFLDGQPQRRVRISACQEGTSCRIDIEDTGPGIPREARSRIFEPFYRVEGSRAPGTGIGLATVRRVVEQRRGRIAVESTEGQGSRFQVWLPLAPAPATQPRPPETEGRPSVPQ